MSDSSLLEAYRLKRDNEIINQLFDRYIHLIYASCINYLKDEDKAKDAAMEIFESLGEKILKHDIRNFKPWLHMVARNHCLMDLRNRKENIPLQNVEYYLHQNMEIEPELHLTDTEVGFEELLRTLLEKLKLGQRQCLKLMYFQNKSYKEIALTTGFTEQQVKSYIQNGKRNLKLMIEARCGGEHEQYGTI